MPLIVHCAHSPTGVRKEVLDQLDWKHSCVDWNLWLPTLGGPKESIEKALLELKTTQAEALIGGMPSASNICNKRWLWIRLVLKLGRRKASLIMPETFLPDNSTDLTSLKTETGPWIVKDASQSRRKGIHLTETIDEAISISGGDGVWLIQKRLTELLTITDHRFHLRTYLLLVRDAGVLTASLHPWGVVIYAKSKVHDNSYDAWITPASSDWAGPVGAPRDLPLLLDSLAAAGLDASTIMGDMGAAIHSAVDAVAPKLLGNTILQQHRCFELLGVDFVIDHQLKPWLLEINRKPALSPRFADERPKRRQVFSDVLAHVGLPLPKGNFINIGKWDSKTN